MAAFETSVEPRAVEPSVALPTSRSGWIANADLLSVKRKKLAAASAGDYVLIGGGYTSGAKGSASRGYRDEVDLFHASDGALGSLDPMNAR